MSCWINVCEGGSFSDKKLYVPNQGSIRQPTHVQSTTRLTVADKRGGGSGQSAPPQASHAIGLDPIPQQLQSFFTSSRLLRRFQRVDRREGHAKEG